MTIKVRVFHNETSRFTEFNPRRDALRLAVEFELPLEEGVQLSGGAVTQAILADVFEQLNIGGDMTPATEYTKHYREAANRSLSVGDVIVLDSGSTILSYAVADLGWTEIFNGDVLLCTHRYLENPDTDRLASLPYVWTEDGFIDVEATQKVRKTK